MSTSLTEDDVRLLEKTISIRERLIDNIVKTELPAKARDIDSFTNLLESVDRSIFSKAKIKLEDTNSRVNEETKEVLRNMLLNLHKNNSILDNNVIKEIPSFVSSNTEITEGELILKHDNQDVSEYM